MNQKEEARLTPCTAPVEAAPSSGQEKRVSPPWHQDSPPQASDPGLGFGERLLTGRWAQWRDSPLCLSMTLGGVEAPL